jgi:hypothetical protein
MEEVGAAVMQLENFSAEFAYVCIDDNQKTQTALEDFP